MVSATMDEQSVINCLKDRVLPKPVFCENYRTLGVVNIILDLSGGMPSTILIKRVEDLRDPWSGDICFPGGKVEEDEDILDALYRETLEEICLAPKDYEIIGFLPSMRPSNLPETCVVPVLSIKSSKILPLPGLEATRVYYMLLDSRILYRIRSYQARKKDVVEGYRLHMNEVVWGLTYRVLNALLAILYSCRSLVPQRSLSKRSS